MQGVAEAPPKPSPAGQSGKREGKGNPGVFGEGTSVEPGQGWPSENTNWQLEVLGPPFLILLRCCVVSAFGKFLKIEILLFLLSVLNKAPLSIQTEGRQITKITSNLFNNFAQARIYGWLRIQRRKSSI